MREAESQTVASAREYDQLRDQTLREVKVLFSQVKTQQEVASLLRDSIVPSYEQAFDLSLTEYQTGQTSYVQMIDNWRELLRFRLMHQQIETQLRQSLASLARVVGEYELSQSTAPAPLPMPDNPPRASG